MKLIKGSLLNISTLMEIITSDIWKVLKNLDSLKTAQEWNIPTKIIRNNIDISAPILSPKIYKLIDTGKFLSEMKSADVNLVFKKEHQTNKDNYRPINILPNL